MMNQGKIFILYSSKYGKFETDWYKLESNIIINIKEVGWLGVDWIQVVTSSEHGNEPSLSWEYVDQLSNCQLSKKEHTACNLN
jgi:hypothetical protein